MLLLGLSAGLCHHTACGWDGGKPWTLHTMMLPGVSGGNGPFPPQPRLRVSLVSRHMCLLPLPSLADLSHTFFNGGTNGRSSAFPSVQLGDVRSHPVVQKVSRALCLQAPCLPPTLLPQPLCRRKSVISFPLLCSSQNLPPAEHSAVFRYYTWPRWSGLIVLEQSLFSLKPNNERPRISFSAWGAVGPGLARSPGTAHNQQEAEDSEGGSWGHIAAETRGDTPWERAWLCQ